jgi:hypothetical protein
VDSCQNKTQNQNINKVILPNKTKLEIVVKIDLARYKRALNDFDWK